MRAGYAECRSAGRTSAGSLSNVLMEAALWNAGGGQRPKRVLRSCVLGSFDVCRCEVWQRRGALFIRSSCIPRGSKNSKVSRRSAVLFSVTCSWGPACRFSRAATRESPLPQLSTFLPKASCARCKALIAKGCISEGCIAAPSACRTMIVHCTTSVWHSLHDFVARQGGHAHQEVAAAVGRH